MIKSQIIHLDMLINFDIVEFCIITPHAPIIYEMIRRIMPIQRRRKNVT